MTLTSRLARRRVRPGLRVQCPPRFARDPDDCFVLAHILVDRAARGPPDGGHDPPEGQGACPPPHAQRPSPQAVEDGVYDDVLWADIDVLEQGVPPRRA